MNVHFWIDARLVAGLNVTIMTGAADVLSLIASDIRCLPLSGGGPRPLRVVHLACHLACPGC